MELKHVGQKHLDNFRSVLSSRGLDAILLANLHASDPQGGDYSLYYASNLLRRYQAFVILTPDDCKVWVAAEELDRAREDSWLADIEAIPPSERWGHSTREFADIMTNQLKTMVGKDKVRVGVDGLFMRAAMGLALVRPGITLEDVGRELQKARVIKDEHELRLLRKACQIVDAGVYSMMDAVHEGVTEYELAALSECEMRKLGADCFWWKTLVASGPEAERWLASPTHRKIKNGDLIITDLTPVYEGYAGDIARTFVCGKASAEQFQVFDLAERALDAAVSALRDGVTCGEVMEVAALQVQGSPYEQFYVGAGHGIGLYDDTYPLFLATIPQMSKMPASMLNEPLRADTVVAIEIIITVPGVGGVRLEDNYVITTDRPELLTNVPIQIEV